MDKCFEGKRVLVTGGCTGNFLEHWLLNRIKPRNRNTVLELWRCGANIVALSDQKYSLNKLKLEYPSIEIACVDLRNWEETREVVDSLGVFHGLVNCAGIIKNEAFFDCSPTSFEDTITVNAKAILNVSQVVAKKMVENEINGSIVNISSQASKVGFKDHLSYCASKGALDAMTRVMAVELGPHGIRVNTVNPTVVLTDLGRKAWADPEKSANMLSKIPLGRFCEIHEVVNAIVFLLSDKASMINGVNLPIDGGFLAT